jgi:hypothetical protein
MAALQAAERPLEDSLSAMRISESDQGALAFAASISAALISCTENAQMNSSYGDSSVPRVSALYWRLLFRGSFSVCRVR